MNRTPTNRIAWGIHRLSSYRRLSLLRAALRYLVLSVAAALALIPLLWLISESSNPANQAIDIRLRLLPSRFDLLANVAQVFRVVPFARYFANSVLIVVVLSTTDIVASSMAGFALAKFRFPFRRVLFYFVLITLMMSFVVTIVPMYILIRRLGWLDTYLGLMAPSFVSAFGVFFMRQYISGIPNEYLDAARIDGAAWWNVYSGVVLPMIRPAIVTLAVFRFVWEWDSLLWPLISVANPHLRTLPLGLTLMVDQLGWSADYSMTHVLTASLLATMPVIVVFLLLQRQFMSAMTMSGLKL